MQVLYKDEEGFLAVMEVTKAAYIEDEELRFFPVLLYRTVSSFLLF